MSSPDIAPDAKKIWLGRLWRLVVLAGLLALVHFAGQASLEHMRGWVIPSKDVMGIWPLVGAAIVFALFLAIPFVPGMEIGLAMMMMFGVRGVALVYLATLGGLSISFLVGRWVSLKRLGGILRWLRLERASRLVAQIDDLDRKQRIDLLSSLAPGRWAAMLVKRRHVMLAILLNMPGNAVLGGGGGIGFLMGASGLLSYPWYLVTVSIAILPFPLFFLWQALQ